MKLKKFNDEVFYAEDSIVRVDSADIEKLKQKARQNPRRRARICAHSNIDDSIHEMLIVHEKSCYVRPHKHANKTESFHIIEGKVDIILFHECIEIIFTSVNTIEIFILHFFKYKLFNGL